MRRKLKNHRTLQTRRDLEKMCPWWQMFFILNRAFRIPIFSALDVNLYCGWLAKPRTELKMSSMTERRLARRYDLTLPVSIRFSAEKLVVRQEGKTRDISTKGLYFVIEGDLEAGSALDLTLTLPGEITYGSDVFVRAQGKVVRVERRLEEGEQRMGVAAVIERYDIVRGEGARA